MFARSLAQLGPHRSDLTGYEAPLEVGSPAHLTLVDPQARRSWSPADLRGRSANTPYTGRELPGTVVTTIHAGTLTVRDGNLVDPASLRSDSVEA